MPKLRLKTRGENLYYPIKEILCEPLLLISVRKV